MSEKKYRILAVGTGPLLDKGVKKIGGQCLRTWHFTKPLIDKGHTVKLLTIPIPDKDIDFGNQQLFTEKTYSGFSYITFGKNHFPEILPEIQKIHNDFKPDVLLGINTYPSYLLCSLKSIKPIWSDLNGWCMVEGQTKAFLDKNDGVLDFFWKLERRICLRSDKISTVSEPQRLALIGELASLGRLNKDTFNYSFGASISNAVNELHANFIPSENNAKLRGIKTPKDAFILLWSGGFNTWTDVDSLYKITDTFLRGNENRYFVATGGIVDGHDERTYIRFKELVKNSSVKDRIILEDWIETEKMLCYYSESDMGINLDSENYETQFGARNRITNMLASGLPVITTLGTEISIQLVNAGVGYGIKIGNTESFILKLNEAANNKSNLLIMKKMAREWAIKEFSYEKTTQPLIQWLQNPQPAPDNLNKITACKNPEEFYYKYCNNLEKEALFLENNNIDEILIAQRDLNIIRSKSIYKLLKKLKKIFSTR